MKVFVGLSGGVDSSVTALLLKQAGYDVYGVFMKNWAQESEECQLTKDLGDAQQIAEMLDIPFQVVDFSAEYWDHVFEEFLRELEAGRTPNPDILCNQYIKFDKFYHWCKSQGAEKIATGHYASLSAERLLMRPADDNKDQTYFLWSVKPTVFKDVLFPLGELTKVEVRQIAQKHGLITHNKNDSTGICFIGPKNYRQFLSKYLHPNPGPILTTEGVTIGTHQGLMFYTLGQRSGLHLGGQKGYSELPWYIIEKNFKSNSLLVSQDKDHPFLLSDKLYAKFVNWQTPPEQSSIKGLARIRHLQELQPCIIYPQHDRTVLIKFDSAQRAITPGQSLVLYQDKLCLGGGIIEAPYWPIEQN